MITVTKTPLPALSEYTAYLEQIWNSNLLTNNGPLYLELTRRLKGYLGVEQLELVGNGTLALQLAIKALGLAGEIITTPYSYVATTNAILWENCEPVFVDIEPANFTIDASGIEAAITPKTSAILATHVYGYPCDVEGIRQIAERHGLKVIYDAAHAFGVSLNGRPLADHGDCSTLSFHATKVFHTAEGGAVVCRDTKTAERVYLMSKFGHLGEDSYLDIGINAKLSELHAAMGLAMLPKVEGLIEARAERAGWYDEALAGCALRRPVMPRGLKYNYAYYPVIFPDAGAMNCARAAMLAHGIGPRRYFYPSLNTLPFLQPKQRCSCPVSESTAARALVLPMSYETTLVQVREIAAIIKAALR
jgi:dTDP-4-amino-4,6-dideoxygalactose transaminase